MQTFEATSWEMSISLSVDFASDHAAYGKSQFQMYFLETTPMLQDLKSFASEIYDDTVHGFIIKTVP